MGQHVPERFSPSGLIRWWRQPAQATNGLETSLPASSRYPVTTAFAVVSCAAAPAYVVRWHVGPFPTTLLEGFILLSLAAFAVEWWRQRAPLRWRTPVTLPAALFLLAGGISVLVAPDHRAALGIYRAYLLEPIAFGLVLVNIVDSSKRALEIAAGLAAGGLVAGLANATVIVVALRHPAYDILSTPPVVIYQTANATALFLVPLIAFAGAVALYWPSRRERLVAIGFLLLAIPSVLISFSRGGYLALAAVALGLAISHRRRWMLLAGAVVSAGIMLLIPAVRHRVFSEFNFQSPQNTLVGRFELWSVTLRMLRHHVFFGAGLSGFADTLAPYWNPTHTDRFIYPHDIVLTFWSETGLIGLAAFALIMAFGAARTWRGWREGSAGWRAVNLGVLMALFAVLVHGLVDVPYFKNDLSLEFWALLALAMTAANLRLAPESDTGSKRRAGSSTG